MLPHCPATCSACFALLSPYDKCVSTVVRRLLRAAPPDTRAMHDKYQRAWDAPKDGTLWYQSDRMPLCQQRKDNVPT